MAAANRLVLDATLTAREPLRYTPAGLPAIDCMLRHASMQAEAGGERKVECEIAAVAFADIARLLATLELERPLRCEGFLARRYRTGTSLALHITRFIELKGN
ncbi:MAG TPA: primosomal replication protein N [Casimicrobiaceae bacterium]|nr:primosomal replication protein N [Casimicrobiaceae bacterium]